MDIDAVIAEATKVEPEAKASEVEVSPEIAPEAKTEAAPEVKVETPEVKEQLTEEQLKKREYNRQSHLNSKLAKMRRENNELREAVKKSQTETTAKAPQAAPSGAPVRPTEDKFNTWGEYQEALDKYRDDVVDYKIEQRDTKASEATKSNTVNAQAVERINKIAAEEEKFAKANPEYTALYTEHKDFMDNLPRPVAEALMEADNASLALFALMKEGKLETLEDMSPYKLSMEIGKAEIRGEAYLAKPATATNAPAPITANRGTGNTSKALADKSVEELMKQFAT